MNSDKELLRLIEHLPMEDFERIIVTEIIKGEEDEKILKKLLEAMEDMDDWIWIWNC